jgi:hypothetical protein
VKRVFTEGEEVNSGLWRYGVIMEEGKWTERVLKSRWE